MKRKTLRQISVRTTPEAEDAVMELLQEQFSAPASSYTDTESREVTAAVYLSTPVAWPARRTALLRGLSHIRQCGLNVGPGRLSLRTLPRSGWADAWKRHFKPIDLAPHLLVKPGWSRRQPRQGQAVVILDPGLSFGTGQHPTTGFCLAQIVARRPRTGSLSFLDVGTGSGILAIAAARLGYRPVEALDFDPVAVRVARENARRNRVRLKIDRADLTSLPRASKKKYHLICANLISDLLIRELDRLVARLQKDGVIVLAGILKAEFSDIENACKSAGLRRVAARTEGEWHSGAFAFRQS